MQGEVLLAHRVGLVQHRVELGLDSEGLLLGPGRPGLGRRQGEQGQQQQQHGDYSGDTGAGGYKYKMRQPAQVATIV